MCEPIFFVACVRRVRRSSLFSLSLSLLFCFCFSLNSPSFLSLFFFVSQKFSIPPRRSVRQKIQKSIYYYYLLLCFDEKRRVFFLFLHARTRERTHAHTKGESTHKNEEKGRTHDLVLVLIINHHHFFISSRRHNTNQPPPTPTKTHRTTITPPLLLRDFLRFHTGRERVCVCERERKREEKFE